MCAQITPTSELEAVVTRFLRAYATGDKETVVNLLSDDEAVSYVGSADGEIWRGQTLRRTLPAYMDEIPRFSWKASEFRGFSRGDLGWVEWHGDTYTLDHNNTVKFRSVFILALEKGVWRIVFVLNSNPVSNMAAMGYDASGFEDLLSAAEETRTDLGQTGIASVMFTDIADSTALAETLGDTGWSHIVGDHLEMVGDHVRSAGGVLVKTLGDGTMSSFPSASAALRCARVIQHENADRAREPHLRLRVGIHTGDVVENDGDYLGTVVNKAARVAAMAAPDEIRLSDATRIMVGGAQDFRFSEPTEVSLRGLEGTHVTYRLMWQDA